ncbi:MAG: DNA repair protein RecN [Oscillospiraceae bacterium]|nr:DNA repair protein RecN [Oscillospiraceae bacterium]
MLSLLHIENIAVIERAEIAFGAGLNVLTGETGAGKSIVIDALGVIIGLRTSRELVRAGAPSARVSALFDALAPLARALLRENGFDIGAETELLIQREIIADGRQVCRVAGRPATVSTLRRLGEALLQIHGQHDSQALLSVESHLALLDRFAGLEAQADVYQAAFDEWKNLENECDKLRTDEEERARRVEYLTYCCEEIEAARLEEGEEETLRARRRALRNAGQIRAGLEQVCLCLLGDDEAPGAVSQLASAARVLADVAGLDAAYAQLRGRLEELAYLAEDAARDVSARADGAEDVPGELAAVEERLDVLYRLKQKYGGDAADVIAHGARCREELDGLLSADRTLKAREEACRQARTCADALAAGLTKARRAAAETLSRRVQRELAGLDMAGVSFLTEVAPRAGDGALRARGADDVRLLLSANPGEPPKPIARVASGGELSRVMLALRHVLAESDEAVSLVFDEIDAGVSGRAAGRTAERLALLARNRQVLCVTHLPQIAAMADVHFGIRKDVARTHALTEVTRLDEDGRVDEIARLLGGLTVTDITRENAREQMRAAGRFKAQDRPGRREHTENNDPKDGGEA